MMKKIFGNRMKKTMTVLFTAGFVISGFVGLYNPGAPVKASSVELMDRIAHFQFDTSDELEERRRQREQALADAQAASGMVSQLAGERNRLTGELSELNDLSEEQRAQYEIISGQLAAALVAKTEALDSYIAAQENLEETRQMFQERISVMFEYQNKSVLEVLLESDSLAGFFTNMEIITLIADADSQAVDSMEVALENAEAQRDLALAQADEMQVIADEKQAQLDELENRIGVTASALEDISTELDSWTAQENSLEALAASLDAQIVSLQAQYNQELSAVATSATTTTSAETSETSDTSAEAPEEQTEISAVETETVQPSETAAADPTPVPSSSASGVSLQWPTWNHTITSYFGYRVHPIYGDTRFHSGVDIGATFGDTIMAAASGTVIYVETPVPGQNWGGSGYGNYMIIDHGNGVSTLYAHCSNVNVSNGQYVSAGEAIGTVGSTGGSTGAHLHFEVRVNGNRVDPLSCLP